MLSIHLGEAADHVDLFQGKLNRVQLCRAAWNVGGPKLEKKKKRNKKAEQSLEMAFNVSIRFQISFVSSTQLIGSSQHGSL